MITLLLLKKWKEIKILNLCRFIYRPSNMVNMEDPQKTEELQTIRKTITDLATKRTRHEDELKEWLAILDTNNIGMDEPLVDNDGFPRADIEVYQVRHARNRIICIRNDLRSVMNDMEKQLHRLHSLSKDSASNVIATEINPDNAFARVSSVTASSPADEAGIKVNDLIINFGSINSSNIKNFADVSTLVRNSKDKYVKLIIIRENSPCTLYLKPHEWQGPGLLGCAIVPVEDVER